MGDKNFSAKLRNVTHDRKHPDVEHVVLKFARERFPYVVSKPIHQSQQVVNADDGTRSIDVELTESWNKTSSRLDSKLRCYLQSGFVIKL